jgi:hypothetical protein
MYTPLYIYVHMHVNTHTLYVFQLSTILNRVFHFPYFKKSVAYNSSSCGSVLSPRVATGFSLYCLLGSYAFLLCHIFYHLCFSSTGV